MELPVSYLKERTTFDKVLADHVFDGILEGLWDDWERLCSKRQHGDELWKFAPPSRDAIQVWGFALVRGGKVVSTAITSVA